MIVVTRNPVDSVFDAYKAYIEGKVLVFRVAKTRDQFRHFNRKAVAFIDTLGASLDCLIPNFIATDAPCIVNEVSITIQQLTLYRKRDSSKEQELELQKLLKVALLEGYLPLDTIYEIREVDNFWWNSESWEAPVFCVLNNSPYVDITKETKLKVGEVTGYTEAWTSEGLEVTFHSDGMAYSYAYRLKVLDDY